MSMRSMKTLLTPFLEVKLDSGTPGRFSGYGSTFGNVDLGNDRCVKGCFRAALDAHAAGKTLPAMYWMHDRGEPIGDWLAVEEDARGLKVDGQLWTGTQETEASRKAMGVLKGTGPKGLSIGYTTKRATHDQKAGVRNLEEVTLPEISVVGYGMNPLAVVHNIKSIFTDGCTPSIREIEELLRDAGFSSSQAKAFCADGYKALTRDADNAKQLEDEIRELRRLRAVFRDGYSC